MDDQSTNNFKGIVFNHNKFYAEVYSISILAQTANTEIGTWIQNSIHLHNIYYEVKEQEKQIAHLITYQH